MILSVKAGTLVKPRRLDIAVKWRLFRHLMCEHFPSAVDLYRWHIEKRSGNRMQAGLATDRWKRSIDDYMVSAQALAQSVRDGFDSRFPVPVDNNGDILDGSHRLAAALVAGSIRIPIEPRDTLAWAPAWDRAWFIDNGLPPDQVASLERDLTALRGI